MNIESAILRRYNQEANPNEPDVDLLFEVICDYIKEKKWIYHGRAPQQNVYTLQERRNLRVNCFALSDLLIYMSIAIGVSPDDCYQLNIPNFVSNPKSPDISGDYEHISRTLATNENGVYEFDIHCIAIIKGTCFDLLLQAKYSLINHGVNLFESLSLLIKDDDLEEFGNLLPDLLNINEQCPVTGWTLMHQAINEQKYDFAKVLLENNADDSMPDKGNITPLSMLNAQITDPSVSLETLRKTREYFQLKMDILIFNKIQQGRLETSAAKTIQSFWRSKRSQNQPEEREQSNNEVLTSLTI